MFRRVIAAAVGLALVAAACGGDDSGGAATTAATTAPAEAGDDDAGDEGEDEGPSLTVATTTTVAETDEPASNGIDRDATLRVSYSVGPTTFDPANSSSSFDAPSLFLTYDRVVHMDPNAEVVPGLAESWEFNEDGTVLTFNVREGMTFHDGNPIDAEAIVANLERNKAGAAAGDLALVESFEVIDDLTFALTFTGPAGAFPAILSDRAGAVASPAAFGDALDLEPVGSGMYRVVEYVRDARIVYERFEDYWDPEAAAAARIEFNIIQDNVAAFNALRGGQTDHALILPSQVAEAEAAGFTVAQGLTLNIHHIQLNRTRPFLDDVNVRRAMSMAIDRDGMVAGVLLGTGRSASQPFPRGYWGHDPSIEIPPYDPDTARQMLRDAGVPEGHTFEMIVPNTNVYPALAQVAKDNLDAIGLNIEIRIVGSVQTAPIFYGQADGDILLSVFGGRTDPAQHFPLLYTDGPLPNPGGHTWPPLLEVIPDVLVPGTPEERAAAVHAASRIVSDDAVNIILHHPSGIFAFTDQVRGNQQWLIGRPEYRGLGLAAG